MSKGCRRKGTGRAITIVPTRVRDLHISKHSRPLFFYSKRNSERQVLHKLLRTTLWCIMEIKTLFISHRQKMFEALEVIHRLITFGGSSAVFNGHTDKPQ